MSSERGRNHHDAVDDDQKGRMEREREEKKKDAARKEHKT